MPFVRPCRVALTAVLPSVVASGKTYRVLILPFLKTKPAQQLESVLVLYCSNVYSFIAFLLFAASLVHGPSVNASSCSGSLVSVAGAFQPWCRF